MICSQNVMNGVSKVKEFHVIIFFCVRSEVFKRFYIITCPVSAVMLDLEVWILFTYFTCLTYSWMYTVFG